MAWPLERLRFRYLLDRQILHVISVLGDDTVEVVGDPENGVYEWAIRSPKGVVKHSDEGYGRLGVALRDGLIAYYDDSPCLKVSACAKAAS